jgi:hypothetical protein
MPGSPTTQGRPSARARALGRVAFRSQNGVGTLDFICTFAAQWPAYAHPCQRFATHLAMGHA